jgi:hypothetical protein
MGKHLTPLEVAEVLVGSVEDVGEIVGLHRKSPYVWRRASSERDAGDLPSAPVMRRLLAWSDAHGLGLTAEHLIRGASETEIAAILAARSARTETGVAAE